MREKIRFEIVHFRNFAGLVTLNLNGIRSASAKGFVQWAEQAGADCMGVQEVKAQADDVAGRFEQIAGLQGHFHFAQKKGYSGVGLYSRKAPSDVIVGFGAKEFDAEGRYVDGQWQHIRWLNGDQTHQGRHVRLEPGRFTLQRVKFYRYR